MSRDTTERRKWLFNSILTFAWTLVVARFIIDISLYKTFIRPESWSSFHMWITPFGFALISVFAYWYRTRKHEK